MTRPTSFSVFALALLSSIGGFCLVSWWGVAVLSVETSSMYPAICPGSLVLVRRVRIEDRQPLERGRVYVVTQASRLVVKRLVALPGERVFYSAERYRVESLKPGQQARAGRAGEMEHELGSGEYFFVGDNLMNSTDSRDTGSVAETRIRARVFAVIGPLATGPNACVSMSAI
jgi:signal peptidase I